MNPCCLTNLIVANWRLYAVHVDPTKDADTYDYDSYTKALAFRTRLITDGGYQSVSEPVAHIMKNPHTSFFNADKEHPYESRS